MFRSDKACRATPALLCALAYSLQTVPGEAAPPASPDEAAAPASDDDARADAREAYRQGTALARDARWDEALAAFERSYALQPHPITSYNIAFCERAVGHYTRAYALARRALEEHEDGTLGALTETLLASARSHLDQAKQRVARVQVTVTPPDARLVVDGRPLESAEGDEGAPILLAGTREAGPSEALPEGRAEVWLDPGAHVFVMSHDGTDTAVTRRFAPGARGELELVAKEKAVVEVARPAPAAPVRVEAPPPDRTWAYVALGTGAAGLIAGGITGWIAMSKRSDLLDACGPTRKDCPPEDQRRIDSMNLFADLSTIGFAVGGAGIALGTVLWLTADSGSTDGAADTARYELRVGPASASVAGRF
jgi:hypothetical protein